jgi:competence protein ComEC
MTVSFLDVGQGDAIFIESPTGVQVIVDGGPEKNLLKELPKVMPWYDRRIDMIVVTNPDLDHYSGFISFLDRYRVNAILEPGTLSKTETYALLERKIEEKNIQKVIALRGQVIDLGGGATLTVLFPDRDASGLSSNDGSIVMRLSYGDTSVLLQGDSTSKIEEYLVEKDGDRLKSSILKTGHHGSRTSTSEAYVAQVRPNIAIISAGRDNKYGHPHSETLSTLQKYNVSILGTYELGMITFTSNGTIFSRK